MMIELMKEVVVFDNWICLMLVEVNRRLIGGGCL